MITEAESGERTRAEAKSSKASRRVVSGDTNDGVLIDPSAGERRELQVGLGANVISVTCDEMLALRASDPNAC